MEIKRTFGVENNKIVRVARVFDLKGELLTSHIASKTLTILTISYFSINSFIGVRLI
jgi:hypothetical protein